MAYIPNKGKGVTGKPITTDPKARNDGLPGTTGGVAGNVGYGFTPDQYSQKGGRYGKPYGAASHYDNTMPDWMVGMGVVGDSGKPYPSGAVNNDDLLFMNPPAMADNTGGGTHPFDWFANNNTPMGGGTGGGGMGGTGGLPPGGRYSDDGNWYYPPMPDVPDGMAQAMVMPDPIWVGDGPAPSNPWGFDQDFWGDYMGGTGGEGSADTTGDVQNPYPRTRYSGNGYYTGDSYVGGPRSGWGRGSGGYNGDSSIGGVSAVNPQADMDFQSYIDQTFGALQNRLDPIFQQQQETFDQSMVNRGIPIGSEAYNKALQQMDQNKSDAYTQAGLQALGFGADLQNQMFGQDYQRSALANALLRSKWNTDLGYSQLGENARQFDQNLGFNYAGLDERGRQFDETMDFGYFNADRDDMRWLLGYERDINNDQINNERWSDQLASGLITPWMPGQTNVNPFVAGYGYGMDGWNMGMNAQGDYWNALLAALERFGVGG